MCSKKDKLEKKFRVVGTRPIRPDGIEKVTGQALYGADLYSPNMLIGKMLRINEPHALIKSINVSKAQKLPGVKAIITFQDFMEVSTNKTNDILENCLANQKVLYDGHAVAAVAALNSEIAKKALDLIDIELEMLPFVVDVDTAMQKGSPIVQLGRKHENVSEKFSDNVTSFCSFGHGDLEYGYKNAAKVIERSFKTPSVHQGYIEPHACLASMATDGRSDLWCCTQGQYNVRAICADIMGIEESKLRVTASEIGGGFG